MRHVRQERGRGPAIAAALAIAVLGTGCAHVNQEDLDGRLVALRGDLEQQIEEGDRTTRADLERRIDGLDERLESLRAELYNLREEFDVTIQELETALRFNVPVYFGFDEATVQAEGREVLRRFSDVVASYYPEAQLTVEGFTDPSGSAEYNLQLGERRAEAVKERLVEEGLPGDRIRTVSYGEDTRRLIMPDAEGPGTAGWENRRVVIVIDHEGTMPALMTSR